MFDALVEVMTQKRQKHASKKETESADAQAIWRSEIPRQIIISHSHVGHGYDRAHCRQDLASRKLQLASIFSRRPFSWVSSKCSAQPRHAKTSTQNGQRGMQISSEERPGFRGFQVNARPNRDTRKRAAKMGSVACRFPLKNGQAFVGFK